MFSPRAEEHRSERRGPQHLQGAVDVGERNVSTSVKAMCRLRSIVASQERRSIVGGHWDSQSAVTDNYRDSYQVAEQQFRQALSELQAIAADLVGIEATLQSEGAPWTPGRIPEWP